MKMMMAKRMNGLRPYMSESLPYNGVEMVDVIRNAVVAHAWSEKPDRSSAMVRIAVATTVWSSAARNMAIISPMRMVMICRWDRPSEASIASRLRPFSNVLNEPLLARAPGAPRPPR